jgi:hypothetical protein
MFYHSDTEDTEFRKSENFKSETPCSLCLCGKKIPSVLSSPLCALA